MLHYMRRRLKKRKKYKMVLRKVNWSSRFTANKPLWGQCCFLSWKYGLEQTYTKPTDPIAQPTASS